MTLLTRNSQAITFSYVEEGLAPKRRGSVAFEEHTEPMVRETEIMPGLAELTSLGVHRQGVATACSWPARPRKRPTLSVSIPLDPV